MSTELELSAAREFVERLDVRMKSAYDAATRVTADFSVGLAEHVALCRDMATQLRDWSQRVFRGQTPYDAEVEAVLLRQTAELLRQTKSIAALARTIDNGCYAMPDLHELHYHLADLNYLQENWIQPKLSVSPAPRVKIPEATVREMLSRLQAMRQSAGWIPDPGQVATHAHVPQS